MSNNNSKRRKAKKALLRVTRGYVPWKSDAWRAQFTQTIDIRSTSNGNRQENPGR